MTMKEFNEEIRLLLDDSTYLNASKEEYTLLAEDVLKKLEQRLAYIKKAYPDRSDAIHLYERVITKLADFTYDRIKSWKFHHS